MRTNNNMEIKYYHYTTESRIEEIIESGVIKLATMSRTLKKEKAVAWISTHPIWEPTATKLVYDKDGVLFKLDFEQQLDLFGCARIEVENIGLHTWSKLKHLANIDSSMIEAYESTGLECGGNPSQWFGSLYPIDMNKWIKAEVYKDGKWIEYEVFE